MGNWIIEIKGHGIHHNRLPGDADVIGLEAVKKLLAVDGTTVDSATLTLTAPDYSTHPSSDVTDLLNKAAQDHE